MRRLILFGLLLFIAIQTQAQTRYTIKQIDSTRWELRQVEVIDEAREITTLLEFETDSTITLFLNQMRADAKAQIEYYYDRINSYESRLLNISKLANRFDINVDLGDSYVVVVDTGNDRFRASVNKRRLRLEDRVIVLNFGNNDRLIAREGENRHVLTKDEGGFYQAEGFDLKIKPLY